MTEPSDLLAVVDLLTRPHFEHVAQQLEDGRSRANLTRSKENR